VVEEAFYMRVYLPGESDDFEVIAEDELVDEVKSRVLSSSSSMSRWIEVRLSRQASAFRWGDARRPWQVSPTARLACTGRPPGLKYKVFYYPRY
jgi:hypothetical protein